MVTILWQTHPPSPQSVFFKFEAVILLRYAVRNLVTIFTSCFCIYYPPLRVSMEFNQQLRHSVVPCGTVIQPSTQIKDTGTFFPNLTGWVEIYFNAIHTIFFVLSHNVTCSQWNNTCTITHFFILHMHNYSLMLYHATKYGMLEATFLYNS